MKFRYKADGGPEKTTIYGYKFSDGQATEVPDDAMIDYPKGKKIKIIDKLNGQPNLSQVNERKSTAEKSKDAAS